ncbi:Rab family GTPase [Lysobacter terrae]
MMSVSRKVCLLGDFAVGKTSIVARGVRNTFSEKYLTTVGVKVDSKLVSLSADKELRIVLWDIAGASTLTQLSSSYIKGTQGLLLVADGSRQETVDTALYLREQAAQLLGRDVPAILVLNKSDLADRWAVTPARMLALQQQLPVITVSAKTAEGVEQAFSLLAGAVAP